MAELQNIEQGHSIEKMAKNVHSRSTLIRPRILYLKSNFPKFVG